MMPPRRTLPPAPEGGLASSQNEGSCDGEGGIRTLEAGISPPNALAGRRLQPLGHFSRARIVPHPPAQIGLARERAKARAREPSTTERAGFEPATRLSAGTRFPVALLRPLGHLSGAATAYRGLRSGGLQPARPVLESLSSFRACLPARFQRRSLGE